VFCEFCESMHTHGNAPLSHKNLNKRQCKRGFLISVYDHSNQTIMCGILDSVNMFLMGNKEAGTHERHISVSNLPSQSRICSKKQ
jgi:hypothetical protein